MFGFHRFRTLIAVTGINSSVGKKNVKPKGVALITKAY